jgi:polyhydroxybutyrate depolymerase
MSIRKPAWQRPYGEYQSMKKKYSRMNRQFINIIAGLAMASATLSKTIWASEPVVLHWLVEGVNREALICAPDGNAGKSKSPLVFAFHGHGGSMHQAAKEMRFHQIWPESIVVYMQGLPTPSQLVDPEGLRSGWQHEPGQLSDRDIKFFDAVLSTLQKKYKVNENRIFATGSSNGGVFTYLLWAQRGETFAAFAPCACGIRGEIKLTVSRPALHIAGENDHIVNFEHQQKAIKMICQLNGCAEKGEPWGPPGCMLYHSSKDSPVVTFIHPGPHGLPKRGPEIIVKFFKEIKAGNGKNGLGSTPVFKD